MEILENVILRRVGLGKVEKVDSSKVDLDKEFTVHLGQVDQKASTG